MELLNPLNNPVFLPVALSAAGLLTMFLAWTLYAERRNLGRLMQTSLFPRWLSSAILAPTVILSVFAGPLTLALMVTVMALVSVWEFGSMTKLPKVFLHTAYVFGAAVPLVAALAPHLVPTVLMISFLTMGTIAVFSYKSEPNQFAAKAVHSESKVLQHAVMAFFAVAYAPLLGSFAVLISRMDGGAGTLLALVAAVGLSDTCAFICGKTFGKRKMAPHVSPNKTWAGATGNVLGAYLGFSVVLLVGPALPLAVILGLPVLIAAASIMGDLFESLIKRTVGIKDAGTWLPGFGGILDRIDSLLFVLPVSYLVLSLVL